MLVLMDRGFDGAAFLAEVAATKRSAAGTADRQPAGCR